MAKFGMRGGSDLREILVKGVYIGMNVLDLKVC